jgi:hypothetical protein
MSAITHEADKFQSELTARTTTGKLVLAILFAWMAFGPLSFFYYENYINTLQWHELAALPGAQAEEIKASYFFHAMLNYFYGAAVWVAGIIILAVLSWRTRSHR